MTRKSTLLALLAAALMLAPGIASAKVIHYELYSTDGYINLTAGVWPAPAATPDTTTIAGWPAPVYIWGFTDVDPNGVDKSTINIPAVPTTTYFTVPAGAGAPQGGPVGNAKFPAPYIEVTQGDDVYITLHNRGFYQGKQKVQDDHTIHLHGITGPTQYDGFPESAGGYTENLRYFWEEGWYKTLDISGGTGNPCGTTGGTACRDNVWNSLPLATQQNLLKNNIGTALFRSNLLNPAGGVTNQFNIAPWPAGVGGLTPAQRELATQFTYYFRAQNPGTYMYHCHVTASEHVQMGMYGALVIKPQNNPDTSVYGGGSNDTYTLNKDYTWMISEFDTKWHTAIEIGTRKGFYPPNWQPQLWFLNGRTFPQNIFQFASNAGNGAAGTAIPALADPFRKEPRYDMFVKVNLGDDYLIRMINMGYQPHAMHQHGWHMRVVGSDAKPSPAPYEKMTINLGSGETYDLIVNARPIPGVSNPTNPADNTFGFNTFNPADNTTGAKIASPLNYIGISGGAQIPNWGTLPSVGGLPGAKMVTGPLRQLIPMHDHYDYQVTTNGLYPGGGLALIEGLDNGKSVGVSGSSSGNNPGYPNPYLLPVVGNAGPFLQLWGDLLTPLCTIAGAPCTSF